MKEENPVRLRAADLERLIDAHRAARPKLGKWLMPRHPRADNRAWLDVDSPRGRVHRQLPRGWNEPDPLRATLDDLEEGAARWVELGWRASYSSYRWVYVPSEGWREPDGHWMSALGDEGDALFLDAVPLGVLEFMRDLDAGVAAMGRVSDLDLVLAAR